MAETATPDAPTQTPPPDAPSLPTEVEHDGRIFAGVGATEESLKQTIADLEARKDATEPTSESGATAPVKPEPIHKRIAKLTADREEVGKQLNSALDQVQALTKRLEAVEKERQQSAPAAQPEPVQPRQPAPAAPPAITEEPKLESYLRQIGQPGGPKDWDEAQQAFAQANNAYILQAVGQVVGQQQQQQQTAQTFLGMKQRGSQKYPDFDAKIAAMDAYPIFPVEMQRATVGRPNAEDIWYKWATDPLFALQSVSAFTSGNAQAFDQMLSTVTPTVPAPSVPAASPVPAITVPPPPMQPVGGASPTQARTLDDLAARGGEDYDSSGWRERRAQDRRGGRLR